MHPGFDRKRGINVLKISVSSWQRGENAFPDPLETDRGMRSLLSVSGSGESHFNEVASLTLQLNNGNVGKSICELNSKAKELRKTINEIKKDGCKGGENWQRYKNDLKNVQTATTQLKKEVNITMLTYVG